MKKALRFALALGAGMIAVSLSGCAGINTAVAKRNLDVQSRISTAIFVEPVKRELRTVYVDIRSSVQEFDRSAFKRTVVESFAKNDNGYSLTDDPDAAQYHMNVFVLSMEKASPTAAEAALKSGYHGGSAATAGLAVGAVSGRGKSMVAGAILGAVGETVGNALVQDVTFLLIADVQIKERAAAGAIVRKDTKIDTQVSDAGTSRQTVSEATDRKEYRTRIVTTANKANLDIAEAQPLMFGKTAYAMSGFF
jgi:hypothetical protein